MVPVVILVETNFVTVLFILSHVSTQRMRGGETIWTHMLKFMQCSLMLLSCIYVLCYTEPCGKPGL